MSDNRAVIFDFDGLILDTETVELNIWLNLFSQSGISFNLEAYLKTIGSITDNTYEPSKVLADKLKNGAKASDIYLRVEKQIIEQLSETKPLPGVLEVIKSAKTLGLKVAVGSSSKRSWVKPHLERLDLLDKFDTVVTFEDVTQCKPSPEIFLKVLERLDVQPNNAIVLEDSANGVIAANRAGIPVVVVPNLVTRHQDFSGAALQLTSLVQLDLSRFFSV